MKVKLIIISIVLLLVMVFACGCIPFMEKLGLVSPTDEEQLTPQKASPDGLVKVLIGFKEKPGAAQQAMVRGVGGKIKYTYHIVDAIAASIPEASIAGLEANPNVTHVHPDGRVQTLDDAELDNSWGVKHIGAGVVHDSGNMGTGVKVAIIDTGIDYTHSDLDDNYVEGYDFVNSDYDPMDDNGHGTHVAGTVAAEDDSLGVVGVAPEAHLYALKVLDATGAGYWSDVIAAIEWSMDPNADGDTLDRMDVINMSLGGTGTSDVEAACQAAYDAGILLVAAAGNSGNPPGKGDNISDPAGYASVIAVAATNQNDKRASWSSTGPDLELSAPGVDINSTLLGGGYGEKSGTSMASPHVAGVAALVIAGEGLSNVEVRTRLQGTADDLGDAGWDPKYGYGLVDAAEAAGVETNEPPTVSIDSPADGSTFDSGATISFSGTASDFEDGDLTANLVWTSSRDGEIGTGGSFSTTLSDDEHTITAEVIDLDEATGSDSISITVGTPSEGVTVKIIEPNTMQAGTTEEGVTITGSGFMDGAEVTFENGDGPSPTASNVVVADDTNTITATVTAKSGGPPRDRVWDVRVTNTDGSSGVLVNGFTVNPQ